jgi:hypothetical protein
MIFDSTDEDEDEDEVNDNEVTEIDIMQSSVATIKGGHHVDETSYQSGITYCYDKCSRKCVIGLSVMEGINFVATNQSKLVEEAKSLIQTYQQEKYKLFFARNKIYAEETCCICMSDKPNVIFYQCGHQCVDSECVKGLIESKCPFCRANIQAQLLCNSTSTHIQSTTGEIVSI